MQTHRHTSPSSFPTPNFIHTNPSLLPMQADSDHEAFHDTRRSLGKGYDSITFADSMNTCSRTMANLQCPAQISRENLEREVNFEHLGLGSQLQNGKSSKIRNIKQLLPVELTTLLSPPYEDLLKAAALIDQALLKQKKYECMDSLLNLSSLVYSKLGFTVDKIFFGQVNFLSSVYYQIYQDPLKNLVVRLPKSSNSLTSRKRMLRTALYKFAVCECQKGQEISTVQETIPYLMLQPCKTARFFPKNKYYSEVKQSNLLKEKFLADTKQQVLERQVELEDDCSISTVKWGITQLFAFVQEVISIYHGRAVNNLFKANLIDLLSANRKTEDTKAALTLLLSTNALLHQSSQSGPCILSLELEQKQKCLLVLTSLGLENA